LAEGGVAWLLVKLGCIGRIVSAECRVVFGVELCNIGRSWVSLGGVGYDWVALAWLRLELCLLRRSQWWSCLVSA
jgi:hypothetical protein